LVNEINLTQLF